MVMSIDSEMLGQENKYDGSAGETKFVPKYLGTPTECELLEQSIAKLMNHLTFSCRDDYIAEVHRQYEKVEVDGAMLPPGIHISPDFMKRDYRFPLDVEVSSRGKDGELANITVDDRFVRNDENGCREGYTWKQINLDGTTFVLRKLNRMLG